MGALTVLEWSKRALTALDIEHLLYEDFSMARAV